MNGENLPAVLLNPVHAQTNGVVPYVVVSQDPILPGTFVTWCTKKLLERLKVCSALMVFPFNKRSTDMRHPHNKRVEDYLDVSKSAFK
jgi:hypothetical protein